MRCAAGGYVYHVLNRANGRLPLFHKDGDYAAWERVLAEALQEVPVRLLAYCLLPNHWHLVVWPNGDGDLSRFTGWLTLTHTQRWHAHYDDAGTGHLYQGRFKSFPVQEDEHFLTVCRYVERNALRARLVERAEHWRWSSLWRRTSGRAEAQTILSDWPVPRPDGWVEYVNDAQTAAEEEAVRRCVRRGQPFGDGGWVERAARDLGLESTLRPLGRPCKNRAQEIGS